MTENYIHAGLPNDLLTQYREGIRRIAVDSQQTSYEDNTQFRFFERLSDVNPAGIPFGSQLVYRIVSANPINVFLRSINIWQGGREYLVYPADGLETYSQVGEVDVSNKVFPINGILRKGLSSHPASGVSIYRKVGVAIFSTPTAVRNGTAVLTDGNSNRAASAYQANGDRSGVAAGQSFYLVFNHIGSNNNTFGLYAIHFEERFGE